MAFKAQFSKAPLISSQNKTKIKDYCWLEFSGMTVEYDHIFASTDPDCFVYWLFKKKFEELIKHHSFQI